MLKLFILISVIFLAGWSQAYNPNNEIEQKTPQGFVNNNQSPFNGFNGRIDKNGIIRNRVGYRIGFIKFNGVIWSIYDKTHSIIGYFNPFNFNIYNRFHQIIGNVDQSGYVMNQKGERIDKVSPFNRKLGALLLFKDQLGLNF